MPGLDIKILQQVLKLETKSIVGSTGIDISAQVWTGFLPILQITPPANEQLNDLVIDLDFDKATDGVNEVATASDTVDCQLQTKIDGTNWVTVEAMTAITLSGTAGTIATGKNGHRFRVGMIDVGAEVRVVVKLSAERADCYIPFRITYQGAVPTVTVQTVA